MMRLVSHIGQIGLAALVIAGLFAPASAAQLLVSPDVDDLQAVLDRAADSDEVRLTAGTYRGPLRIDHPVTLAGDIGTIIVGSGHGNVITMSAPGGVVRGLDIRGSGRSLETMDSGVFVEQGATGAIVEDNRFEDNLFGIYLHGASDAVARHNCIIGLRQARTSESGNGVSVWNAPGAKVIDNDFRYGRDGIFAISSRDNLFSGNRFRDLRFAVHNMYSNDGVITNNISRGNIIGYAMMFSKHFVLRDNVSDHDRDRGILFNSANGSEIVGNTVIGGPQPSARWATVTGMSGSFTVGLSAVSLGSFHFVIVPM